MSIIYVCKRCHDRLPSDKLCPRVTPAPRGKGLKASGPGELCGGLPLAVDIAADISEAQENEHARILGKAILGLLPQAGSISLMAKVERAASMRFIPTRDWDGRRIPPALQLAILRERASYVFEEDQEDPVIVNSAIANLQSELAECKGTLEAAKTAFTTASLTARELNERLRVVLNELSELSAEREALFTALRSAIGVGLTPDERLLQAVEANLPPSEFFQRELRTLTDIILNLLPEQKNQPAALSLVPPT